MVRLTLDTPAGRGALFTEQAAAGMVGQRVPVMTLPPSTVFEPTPAPVCRMALVVAAALVDDGRYVRLTVEVDEQ